MKHETVIISLLVVIIIILLLMCYFAYQAYLKVQSEVNGLKDKVQNSLPATIFQSLRGLLGK